jgi:outer membrane protein
MFTSRLLGITLFLLLFSLSVSADFLRVEGGIGLFQAVPGGSIENKNSGTDIDLKSAGVDTENDLYAWAYLKHPIPIIPDVRIEYLALTNNPTASDSFDVKELDGILYYNLLDDTLFVTLDLGLDAKYVETDGAGLSASTTIGLLYGRVRIEPTDWLGIEALLEATNYGENKGYDARIKLDYTMTFVPVVQPGLEIGYRIHKIQYELGDYIDKAEYTGVYAGLTARF